MRGELCIGSYKPAVSFARVLEDPQEALPIFEVEEERPATSPTHPDVVQALRSGDARRTSQAASP